MTRRPRSPWELALDALLVVTGAAVAVATSAAICAAIFGGTP